MFGFLLWIISLGAIVTVPTGNIGVVTNFGHVTGTLQPGIHVLAPLGINGLTNMDGRVQKDDVKAEAGSKDLQTVNTDVVVNYHIRSDRADSIFQKVGDMNAAQVNIVEPAVSEVVKAAVAKKTAEEVLTKRPELKHDIDVTLKGRLATYNIVLDDVSIVNVDFSPQFNAAIEAKQVAQQQAQQAEFTAEKASKDAEAVVNKAKGDAEAQRLQQQTLTPEVLQKLFLDKWDGHLPTYMAGQLPLPILNTK